MLEEAAGISHYRYRRSDAMRRLNQAEENLLRLRDILTELESRVGPLRVQSEKAQKFLEYAGEKKTLEIGLWLFTIEKTKNNDKFTLNIALSYGGRAEIVDAVNKMLKEGIKEITEESFRDYLYAGDIPDPAIIIRTGGEMRLSNFLMWESAYSEIYVTDTWWPDFSEEDLIRAFKWYETRDRRFGGIKTT
jgi:undecaprenyl diphosphate synthase